LDLRQAIQSAPQPAERVQPGDGPFYEPAFDSQTSPVFGVTLGKNGSDAHPTQDRSERVGVKTTISLQPLGKLSFGARLAANRRRVDEHVEHLGDLVDIGRRGRRIEGNALGVGQHMMLASRFAAIRWVWPSVLTSFGRFGEGSIDKSTFPVDLIGAIEFGQEQRMELQPDAGLMPEAQVVTAGLAATATHLAGQVVPGDAGFQNKENTGENSALVNVLAAGKPKATPRWWRQQWFNALPERIRDERLHGVLQNLEAPNPEY